MGGALTGASLAGSTCLNWPFVFLFAKLNKVALNGLVRAGVALLFQFPVHLLGISAPLVPAIDQVILVRLNERFPLLIDARPFWRLLHLQVGVHPLPTQPHLVSDRGDIDLVGMKSLDLVVTFDPFLMQEHTLLFLALRSARIPGWKLLCFLAEKGSLVALVPEP